MKSSDKETGSKKDSAPAKTPSDKSGSNAKPDSAKSAGHGEKKTTGGSKK